VSEDLRPGALRLSVERPAAGALVVRAAGEIDIATAPALLRVLAEATGQARSGEVAVLDLTEVSFLNSTGLGALVAARRDAEGRGVSWRLCGLQPAVQRVLELTGILGLFAVYGDLAAALAPE
jgi:anti-sigma B factor antagonist